jgi:hypothetical protein
MCGRYTDTRREKGLLASVGIQADFPFTPRYNIEPAQQASTRCACKLPSDEQAALSQQCPMSISTRLRLAALFLVASVSHAAIIQYEASGTFFRSDFPGDVAVGDHFSVIFAYDDTITDVNDNVLAGRFPGALVNFSFHLLPGSAGTYSGGTASILNPIDTFDGVGEDNTAIPDRFYLSASGGDFKVLGNHSFGGILFVLDDYSHLSSIPDAGSRQSLGEQLGGTLNLRQFATTLLRLSADGKNGIAEANVEKLVRQPFPLFRIIAETGSKLRVEWATGGGIYVLTAASSLSAADWRVVDEAQVVGAEEVSVIVDASDPKRFFRLRLR